MADVVKFTRSSTLERRAIRVLADIDPRSMTTVERVTKLAEAYLVLNPEPWRHYLPRETPWRRLANIPAFVAFAVRHTKMSRQWISQAMTVYEGLSRETRERLLRSGANPPMKHLVALVGLEAWGQAHALGLWACGSAKNLHEAAVHAYAVDGYRMRMRCRNGACGATHVLPLPSRGQAGAIPVSDPLGGLRDEAVCRTGRVA